MKCATHPKAETNLRCGKCGKPICPRCMVETPVGARCRDCARLYKLPTYRVSLRHYAKAVAVALGMAVVCGILWVVIDSFSPFYLGLLIGPGIGYVMGEVVSLSVNRKRGGGLATVAGAGVGMSYVIMLLLAGGGLLFRPFSSILSLAAVALGIFFAVNRLR